MCPNVIFSKGQILALRRVSLPRNAQEEKAIGERHNLPGFSFVWLCTPCTCWPSSLLLCDVLIHAKGIRLQLVGGAPVLAPGCWTSGHVRTGCGARHPPPAAAAHPDAETSPAGTTAGTLLGPPYAPSAQHSLGVSLSSTKFFHWGSVEWRCR